MQAKEFCQRYYTERKNTQCVKWDALEKRFGNAELLPMWIADMEFRSPEAVIEALQKLVDHGVFAYSMVPDSYEEAVIAWQEKRHGNSFEREWMRLSPGIVSALYWFVGAFTEEADAIITLNPVYYPFHNAIDDQKRRRVAVDLVDTDGYFTIDFAAFEKTIVDEQVKMFIHCSPHNPVGRVWTEEELVKLFEICERHEVLVVSDEIHQDLLFDGVKHLAASAVAEGRFQDRLLMTNAPSKTFNLAGGLTSNVIIPDAALRQRYDDYVGKVYHVAVNAFGIAAAEASYRGGHAWYEGLMKQIQENYALVQDSMAEFPKVVVTQMEGTYLPMLGLQAYVKTEDMKRVVQDMAGLAVNFGDWFGKGWEHYIRLNIGTHPDLVKQALTQLKEALHRYQKEG